MPKRSNDFQKLVAAVKMAVGQGVIVRESEMLPDRLTGGLREVDVYIEAVVAGHKVIVCVECVDEDRPASVAWVDEMAGKHQSLPTNCLVLAARKGFTKEALAKAEKLGIKILNYESLDPSSVGALFGGASSLWSKVFSVTPQKVVVHVPAAGVLRPENVAVAPDTVIYNHKGKQMGTVLELVQSALKTREVNEEFLRQGDESHKSFEFGIGPLRDQKGRPFCLQKLQPKILRPIDKIVVTGPCNFDVSEFKMQHGKLGDITVAWGSGMFLGEKRLLVASTNPSAANKK